MNTSLKETIRWLREELDEALVYRGIMIDKKNPLTPSSYSSSYSRFLPAVGIGVGVMMMVIGPVTSSPLFVAFGFIQAAISTYAAVTNAKIMKAQRQHVDVSTATRPQGLSLISRLTTGLKNTFSAKAKAQKNLRAGARNYSDPFDFK